jgi:hypothetical protein
MSITVRSDLKQRDVTALELELVRVPGNYLMLGKASSRMAAYLKAAIASGWIVEPETEVKDEGKDKRLYLLDGVDVDDMHPRACYAAGKVISDLMDEFTSVDPN